MPLALIGMAEAVRQLLSCAACVPSGCAQSGMSAPDSLRGHAFRHSLSAFLPAKPANVHALPCRPAGGGRQWQMSRCMRS